MVEIEKRQLAASIGGLATGFMAATLLTPTLGQVDKPRITNVPVLIYQTAANTYGVYADIFAPGRLGATALMEHSIMSFYLNLLAKQERLGREFEQVLFDNLWDLYA